ncbi:MAG: putative iron-regulated membrane protein [Myxococcota bacterium]|jgi:uncharacterized iron-regulated membrane protein
MSRPARILRVFVGLAVVVLLVNLGVLLWLHRLPMPDLTRQPEHDLGPGEQPARP